MAEPFLIEIKMTQGGNEVLFMSGWTKQGELVGITNHYPELAVNPTTTVTVPEFELIETRRTDEVPLF